MNNEPREFTCFDDHDNDGWGNSTLERESLTTDEEDFHEDVLEAEDDA
jgi:hypothetical protein